MNVKTLYEEILPHLQDIYAEGGNMSAQWVHRVVPDALDAAAASNSNAASLVSKIRQKLGNYKGKRDHAGFNALFEAYSEALIFLAARERGVELRAVPEGGNRGKTPDFETIAAPTIGLEIKTLNPVDPIAAVDDVMNRGFEAGYEAELQARANGVGFAYTEWAPHGEGAEHSDAVVQTMAKISSNVKYGQYSGKPTFLVVSLARLGLHGGPVELRRWVDEDGMRNGHLYTVAAHSFGEHFFAHTRDSFDGPIDLGALPRVGILRDHPFIAGVIFVNQVGSENGASDYFNYAVRFHGVWNSDWERDATFSPEDKQAAKRLFETLCDETNDLDDTRSDAIVDDRVLFSAFQNHLGALGNWAGKPPSGPAFQRFMVEADRLHFAWRGALKKVDVAANYAPRDPADIVTGRLASGWPALTWSGRRHHPKVEVPCLTKAGPLWGLYEGAGRVIRAQIVL
ncbi:hypothetical protein [Phenylobacterium montanum]|uniref:Uncharacterized protein n=1 Tax=Phenylobacterium montanum TaxID=2823693 RepID=A0A975G3Z9_9CAUL|nr:hypothetical protein [Caulobacter sp. S6]QUD90157.1 hypothetical protein KCG34_09960 [Caulobacter sp. S6]